MFGDLLDDLRYAARLLRKSPLFTAVALTCVALGAGAVTTIFSAMNAVVLRPLPGASAQDQLVNIDRRSADGHEGAQASYALYERYRQVSAFEGVGAWSKVDLAISVGGVGHAVYGNIVSANYFSVLGVQPAAGRFFMPEEGVTPMASPVVVLSHRFWRATLGGDPSIVGRTVGVNGHPYTVIGIAPPEFRGAFTPLRLDAWVPLTQQPELRPGRDLSNAVWLWTFGRLRPEVSRQAAASEVSAALAAHALIDPRYREYTTARVTPMTGLPEDARVAFLGFAGVFFAAAVLVLLIASVNVGSILTARAVARQREMAVRAALGAGRGRLVRQLLTETLLLFGCGAAGAVALAAAGTSALERLPIPGNTPLLLELSPDLRVLGFALGLSLATGLLFGLLPALRATRFDLTQRLRQDTAGGGLRRSMLGGAVVAGQLALSLLLLVGAGLFVRALAFGARVDPGFTVQGITIATMNTQSWGYDPARGRQFFERLRAGVARQPGIVSASYGSIVPLTLSGSGGDIALRGAATRERWPARTAAVDAGYFDTLEIPVLAGRDFRDDDDEAGPRVAIVNETLAKRVGPGRSALGRTFVFEGQPLSIVGIVADSKYADLGERQISVFYVPMRQRWSAEQTIFVRAEGTAGAAAVRNAIRGIDALAPMPAIVPLAQATAIALLPQQAAAWVTGALGATGLVLAAVGLYGVLSYRVARRRREIGVRLALGARPADILTIIVGDGARMAGLGLALGLGLAALASRAVESLLFEVSPLDRLTFSAVAGLFVAVAFAACYLPARRAAVIDPAGALRGD